MAILFQNQTTNATSLTFPAAGTHGGGPVWLAIAGVFDGATVAIEIDQDGIGFLPLQSVSQVTPDINTIAMASGQRLRLVITGGGASLDISASVSPSS